MKKYSFIVGFILISVFLMTCLTVNAESIKIGVLGPHKFSMGQHSLWSAQIAADEINAAGGISVGGKNYQIEIVPADSNEVLSVVDAVSTAERLVSVNKVDFIIGGHRSEAALAIQELLADKKVIFMNTQSAHPTLVERVHGNYDRFKYFFRLQTNSVELGAAIFAYVSMVSDVVKKELGITKCKAAILAEKAAWTDGIVKAAKETLPKLGMEVVGVWRPSPTASDVTAELTAIKAAGAHIILQAFSGPVGHSVARQWGQSKIPAALVGINTEAGTRQHWQATGGACEYEVLHGIFGPAKMSAKTLPLYDVFMKKHNEYLGATASSYDGVYILAEAAKKAGSLESNKMVTALEGLNYVGAMGKIRFYPKEHKWTHDLVWGGKDYIMAANQWQGGKLKVVWPDGAHGDAYKGVRWDGTANYQMPPWMKTYWMKK
jgi:branched-chain amino acid transport system substrate-binding protein